MDLFHAGGTMLLARRLMDAGLLHNQETILGRSLADLCQDVRETPSQEVVRSMDNRLKDRGGLAILKGSLSPEGCVVKLCGHARRASRHIPLEKGYLSRSPARPGP